MPRPVADSVIVISSSSSSEKEGEERGGSTSRVRHVHHSAAASVGGEKGDGVRKSKKRKEENGAATIGEDGGRRQESGLERRAKPKAPKKKQNKEEEKEKKASLSSANAGEAVTSGGFAHPSIVFALPASPLKRPTAGGKGDGGNGGKNMDRVRKGKRKEREEGPSAVGGGEARRELEETKAKTKRKKEEDKKEKKETFPLRYCDLNGAEAGRPSAVYSSPTNPAVRDVAGGGGGKKTDGLKKKKKRDVETSAVANGKVRSKGEERKSNVKKKDKNGEDTEKKASSCSSYAGDVVATTDEVGRPSPTCSFPMRRVKRFIVGNEDGGRKSGVRTSLDSVFLINKASEFFLELFAQNAYAHAAQEHKRALFYKHLSSTVCDEKRFEFLSDFVPEKVRAEDALKALAEQP